MVLKPLPRELLPAFTVLLLAFTHLSASAGATASVDASSISSGDSVRLQIEIDEKTESGPDLSVLAENFQILDRRTSHSVSIVNGQRSERHTLLLELLPRGTGEIEIPSIPVGKFATSPLALSVAPAGEQPQSDDQSTQPPPSPGALLEATIEPTSVRVGQQLVLTVKVFMDGPVLRPRLHDPRLQRADVLPLGEDRYQAQRDGQDHRVYERRYAIFPQTPGALEVRGLLFEGWKSVANGARSGIGFQRSGQPVSARSEPLTAEVLPKPDGARRERWLPARSLTLSETGPEIYEVRVGEPIERRINLRAEGLMARALPTLPVQAPYQLAKRQTAPRLWDERSAEGVVGIREELISLTPRQPGRYRLPPLSIDWWNTESERWETAKLPAKELVASLAPGVGSEPPVVQTKQDWPKPGPAEAPEAAAKTLESAAQRPSSDAAGQTNVWIWIAAILGLAWIVTILTKRRSKTRANSPVFEPPARESATPELMATPQEVDPLEERIDAVRDAYQTGNAGAAREALLAWAQLALPEQTPGNLARLAGRCPEPLRGQILQLEEAFFSPTPVAWDEQPVWVQLPEFEPTPPQEPASFRRGKPIKRRAPKPDAE